MKNKINEKINELISAEEYNDLNEIVKLGKKATPPLLSILAKHADSLMRKRAAIALGRIRDKTTTKALADRLKDKDPTVVMSVMDALAAIGEKRFGENIIPFLKNPDASVRRHAAKALGTLKAKDARKAIEELVKKEEYEFVREAGENALKKLR